MYRAASIVQSSIHRFSGYCAVYQSSLCAPESGRWRSRITDNPCALARAMTVSRRRKGVRPTRPGLASALIEVVCVAARHSFEKGSRTVVKPIAAIFARPSSSEIVHSPWGAQFDVSMPNQATALIVYGVPLEVTMVEPRVDSQPGSVAAEAAGAASDPTSRRTATEATAAARVHTRRTHVCRSAISAPLVPVIVTVTALRRRSPRVGRSG